jgi:hypothetical protein
MSAGVLPAGGLAGVTAGAHVASVSVSKLQRGLRRGLGDEEGGGVTTYEPGQGPVPGGRIGSSSKSFRDPMAAAHTAPDELLLIQPCPSASSSHSLPPAALHSNKQTSSWLSRTGGNADGVSPLQSTPPSAGPTPVTILLHAPTRPALALSTQALASCFARLRSCLGAGCGRALSGGGAFELLVAHELRCRAQAAQQGVCKAAGAGHTYGQHNELRRAQGSASQGSASNNSLIPWVQQASDNTGQHRQQASCGKGHQQLQQQHVPAAAKPKPAWALANAAASEGRAAWAAEALHAAAGCMEDMVVTLLQNQGHTYDQALDKLAAARTLVEQAAAHITEDPRDTALAITHCLVAGQDHLAQPTGTLPPAQHHPLQAGQLSVPSLVLDDAAARLQALRACRGLVPLLLAPDTQIVNQASGSAGNSGS